MSPLSLLHTAKRKERRRAREPDDHRAVIRVAGKLELAAFWATAGCPR